MLPAENLTKGGFLKKKKKNSAPFKRKRVNKSNGVSCHSSFRCFKQ